MIIGLIITLSIVYTRAVISIGRWRWRHAWDDCYDRNPGGWITDAYRRSDATMYAILCTVPLLVWPLWCLHWAGWNLADHAWALMGGRDS